MRLKILCAVLVLVLIGVAFAAPEVTRDKRTIDVVLRSVADAFGYDIQKRPAVLPPAPTTPAPVVSTFFPPPVAPLPRPARYPLAPRASLPPPKAAPAPAPAPKLPPPPPPPLPPKLPPRRAPKAPPPPPAPKAPPPPPPPAPKAPMPPPPPPPKRPAPLLTESVKKTFNLNFNWNKNVQPGGPAPAPAAPPPAKPPAPAPAPAKPPVAPPPPPPPPPAPAAPAPAAPVPRRNPGGQVYIHKPQLYQEYDYLNTNTNQNEPTPQTLREDFEQQLQEQELNDYPEYQNQYLSQDYSESNKEYATKPTDNDHKHAKEKFKETVNAFWKAYPLTDQHGYKYIALQKPTEQKAQFSQTFPNDLSKYEEYELKPVNKNIAQQQQQHNCPPQQTHLAKVQYPKNTEVIYHQPKNAKVQYPKNNHQPKYPKNTESKNTKVEYPKNTEVIYHQNPKHTASETHSDPKDTEVIYDQLKDTEGVTYEDVSPDYETHEAYVYLVPKDYLDYYTDEPAQPQQEETAQAEQRQPNRRNNNETNHSAETVAHPLYSGILPAQLHHLARSESQSKPYSVPYDYDIESTENKNKFVKKSPAKTKDDDAYHYECCEKQVASHNFDFYTVPEPTRVDLSKYEKLHTDEDEDDGKLSRNAKIQTKEKKVSVIKTNKYENPVKY